MNKLAVSFVLATTLVAHPAWGKDDPFVGEWKLDPAKSQLTDQMKVESLGHDKYAFDFGGGQEVVVADGTDQPGYGGTVLAVTVRSADAWNVVRKQDGKRMLNADWSLSKDGDTLTDRFTSFDAAGTATTADLIFTRATSGAGFVGTWERSGATMAPFVMKIQPFQSTGLSFSYLGKTKDMKFDGKDSAPTGSSMLSGMTFSALRPAQGELDVTDKLKGAVMDTQQITLSADHKTLTMTIRTVGKRLPSILVFERQ